MNLDSNEYGRTPNMIDKTIKLMRDRGNELTEFIRQKDLQPIMNPLYNVTKEKQWTVETFSQEGNAVKAREIPEEGDFPIVNPKDGRTTLFTHAIDGIGYKITLHDFEKGKDVETIVDKYFNLRATEALSELNRTIIEKAEAMVADCFDGNNYKAPDGTNAVISANHTFLNGSHTYDNTFASVMSDDTLREIEVYGVNWRDCNGNRPNRQRAFNTIVVEAGSENEKTLKLILQEQGSKLQTVTLGDAVLYRGEEYINGRPVNVITLNGVFKTKESWLALDLNDGRKSPFTINIYTAPRWLEPEHRGGNYTHMCISTVGTGITQEPSNIIGHKAP